MKKFTKFLMAATVLFAAMNLTACNKDDEKTEPTPNPGEASAKYEIMYLGRTLEPGQVIYCNLTDEQRANDDAEVDVYMKNITDATLNTHFRVELADGPETMNEVPVCYGECLIQQCPYTSEAIQLAPGIDTKPLQLHVYPSQHGRSGSGSYRITVGEGSSLANPQVFYVNFAW